MAVFGTLGFLVTYELLRHQAPRVVAAAICLLLISSPRYFFLVTQWVVPSFPYFFTSIQRFVGREEIREVGPPDCRAWDGEHY